jgi:hypothetical protein
LFVHLISTFLCSFAPSCFQDLIAPMNTLTPARLKEHLFPQTCSAQVSAFHAYYLLSIPSPTTLPPSVSLLHAPLSAPNFPLYGSGFRTVTAGSPDRLAESSSSSYGLDFHLLLLSTVFRNTAVTVDYGPEYVCPKRTFTSLIVCAYARTVPRTLGRVSLMSEIRKEPVGAPARTLLFFIF